MNPQTHMVSDILYLFVTYHKLYQIVFPHLNSDSCLINMYYKVKTQKFKTENPLNQIAKSKPKTHQMNGNNLPISGVVQACRCVEIVDQTWFHS